jgi:hypothetical protein
MMHTAVAARPPPAPPACCKRRGPFFRADARGNGAQNAASNAESTAYLLSDTHLKAKTSADVAAMKKTLKNFLTGTTPKQPAPKPRGTPLTKRAVWRISEHAPMGEWVDPDAAEPPSTAAKAPQPETSGSGWIESSMDLLNGTDVSEDHESTPGELFDEVNARQRAPKRD